MAQKDKEYRKLPGVKKGFLIGKYTLWQGRDHLLHIFSRFGAEDYKRFYFNDIQAVITRKTMLGKIQNIILASFVLLFLVPAFFFDGGWSIFYSIVGCTMFLFLLINLCKGPTCDTRLLTAVQTEKLPSLRRLKTACRVMDRLRDCIQSAQGRLQPEDLNQFPARRAAPAAPAGQKKTAAGQETGRVHLIMFALLLFDGGVAVTEFFSTHVFSTILGSIAGICLGTCLILALVKQHGSSLPGSVRAITWASLGLVVVKFAVGYVVGIAFVMKNPSIAYNQWEVMKSIASLSPWQSPLKLSHDIMTICGALFLGIPGLVLLRRLQGKAKKPAPGGYGASGRPVISRNIETG